LPPHLALKCKNNQKDKVPMGVVLKARIYHVFQVNQSNRDNLVDQVFDMLTKT
jgi:hypothetical protein